jgi:hypothetical protein
VVLHALTLPPRRPFAPTSLRATLHTHRSASSPPRGKVEGRHTLQHHILACCTSRGTSSLAKPCAVHVQGNGHVGWSYSSYGARHVSQSSSEQQCYRPSAMRPALPPLYIDAAAPPTTRRTAEAACRTPHSVRAGTSHRMAPEPLRGEPRLLPSPLVADNVCTHDHTHTHPRSSSFPLLLLDPARPPARFPYAPKRCLHARARNPVTHPLHPVGLQCPGSTAWAYGKKRPPGIFSGHTCCGCGGARGLLRRCSAPTREKPQHCRALCALPSTQQGSTLA